MYINLYLLIYLMYAYMIPLLYFEYMYVLKIYTSHVAASAHVPRSHSMYIHSYRRYVLYAYMNM